MNQEKELAKLRSKIRQVDEELLRLAADRQMLAKQVGDIKRSLHLSIKDYGFEKTVLESTRRQAKKLGIYEEMAEELVKTLIKYSCRTQEQVHGNSPIQTQSSCKQVAIIGGLGQMGQWLGRFFESFGHVVSSFDLGRGQIPLPAIADNSDIIVLATPISATSSILEHLTALKPGGLIFDICSLKSPLLSSIESARKAGIKITSVHPMFGPSAQWLAGRNILFCDSGNSAATQEAYELFQESSANLLKLPLEKHDQLMGYVLGLSHLNNLVFANSLEKSGLEFESLRKVGGTTFTSQLEITEQLLAENQDLYFEIQNENHHTPEIIQKMRDAVEEYAAVLRNRDRSGFKRLMEKGRTFSM